MPPTTLTTERLVLRPPELEDARALFDRYTSDPNVSRFLTWPTHESIDETIAFLQGRWSLARPGCKPRWVICAEGDPAPCGMLSAAGDGHARELGYGLGSAYWGRGIMPEAVQCVATALLQDPEVWRVSAHAHRENIGSQRVLEKAGFQREGILRRAFKIDRTGETPQDAVIYAIVRDDLS